MIKFEWFDADQRRVIKEVDQETQLRRFDLACGLRHALLLVDSDKLQKTPGCVLSVGYNGESQLGRGIDLDQSDEPAPVLGLPTNPIGVAAGETHSVAIDNDGTVWTWGGSSFVRGRQGPASTPMRITKGLNDIYVTSVACGNNHTMVVDRLGKLFAWGNMEDGRLGLLPTSADKNNQLLRPRQVPLVDTICVMNIACGEKHSVILTSDLRVFSTGKSPASGHDIDYSTFTAVEVLCLRRESDPVNLIACGESHTIVSTNTVIMTFGDGSCGKLGLGNELDQFEPTSVTFVDDPIISSGAKIISAGKHHTLVVRNVDNTLWVFGLEYSLRRLVESNSATLEDASKAPQTIPFPKMFSRPKKSCFQSHINHMACGVDFSVILHNDEKLPPKSFSSTEPVKSLSDHTRIANPIKPNSPFNKAETGSRLDTSTSLPFSASIEQLLQRTDSTSLSVAVLSNLLLKEQKRNKLLHMELETKNAQIVQLLDRISVLEEETRILREEPIVIMKDHEYTESIEEDDEVVSI